MLSNLFYTINFSLTIVISIVALIFGFLPIVIVILNRQCRNISNLLICNTAAAAIFYHILNITSSIYGFRYDGSYYQPACIFRAYCFSVACAGCCYSYAIQAVSRLFFTVFYKRKYLLTWRVHWLMILVGWFLSITVQIVLVIFNTGFGLEQESRLCIATSKIFLTSMYSVFINYLLPFGLIATIYGVIFFYARRSTRRVIAFAPSSITARASQNIPVLNIKREIKIMKTMLILIGILSCGGILYMILIFWHVTKHQPPELLYLLAIDFITLTVTAMMIALFFMTKEVKQCAMTYLLNLY